MRPQPFKHQAEGTRLLLAKPKFALFDEMGTGKTRTVIDAATQLWMDQRIRAVVIVAPRAVVSVWADPDDGEIEKWCTIPHFVHRFDRRGRPVPQTDNLLFIVTNYELLRQEARLKTLTNGLRGIGYLLVCDESSRIKSRLALQTKAIGVLRARAARCVLLNGTPMANNLMDFYSPLRILDPEAVHHMTFWEFRNTYAKMGGFKAKQVVGYREPGTSKFLARLTRWVRRVEKKDCLDLPPKLYTTIEVPIGDVVWGMYEEMAEEFVVWAAGKAASVAEHGMTRVLRLSQLACGFLGGVEGVAGAVTVGTHKADAFMEWQREHPESMLVWCRFSAQIDQLLASLRAAGRAVAVVRGGQSDGKRDAEVLYFKSTPGCVLVGQPQSGGWGLNLTEASTVVYMSNDYNLETRIQSEDRAHRSGQKNPVLYVDFVAVSPDGHPTVDAAVVKALRKKEDLAKWSYSKWADALRKEK